MKSDVRSWTTDDPAAVEADILKGVEEDDEVFDMHHHAHATYCIGSPPGFAIHVKYETDPLAQGDQYQQRSTEEHVSRVDEGE